MRKLIIASLCGVGFVMAFSTRLLAATTPPVAAEKEMSKAGQVTFTLAQDAHVTIAIDNNEGIRVRNLFADVPFKQGAHTVEWDGRNDAGEKLTPGDYHWVGLVHGDIHATYQGAFQYGQPPWPYGKTGGWTADHSYAVTVTAMADRMLLGSTEAEWGSGLIATDLDGKKLWGVRWLNQRAWAGSDTLTTIGNRVFTAAQPKDNAVWEVDPATGESWLVVELKDIPKDQQNTTGQLPGLDGPGLRVAGGCLTADNSGDLYVADLWGKQPRTYVFSIQANKRGDKFKLLRVLPVRPWSLAWLPDGRCLAALDKTLDFLDTRTGAIQPFINHDLQAPYGLAVDGKGRIYVSDQGGDEEIRWNPNASLLQRVMRVTPHASMQIKIFDNQGKLLRAMGREGGLQPGQINPQDFWRPAGIALDARGRLWVTEMNFSPKRVSVWTIPDDLSTQAPTLARQFVGPTTYGGGAMMPDPQQPWRIMDSNYGVIFDVNLESGAFKPVELPWRQYLGRKESSYRPDLPFDGKPTTLFTLEGRQYSFLQGGYEHGPEAHWEPYSGSGEACVIGEMRQGLFVPQAAIGNIRMLLRARELLARREVQWLPQAILDAAKLRPDWKALCAKSGMKPDENDVPHVEHKRGSGDWIVSPWPKEISGFIWTDANGDGKMQPDEIQLGEIDDAGSITFDRHLNAYINLSDQGGGGIIRLERKGFNPIGAPIYQLADARRVPGTHVAQIGEDGSRLDYTSLTTTEGKTRWSYPSDRRGARELGSRKWQEALPGAINRIHALRGVVKGPGNLGDLYMLQSTDGMCYLLTRDDGIFIATIFRPYAFAAGWDTIPEAKRGLNLEEYSLQDECFNGSFVQAQGTGQGFAQGHYYLLGFARSAVLELTGLEAIQRLPGGKVQLIEGVGAYAKAIPTPAVRLLPLSGIPVPAQAEHERRPLEAVAGSQFGPGVRFADAEVSAAWDARGLHLKWTVKSSDTMFINNENDWTMLFSTGDVCDLQLQSEKLGRCRYIITMYKGKPVVVRFQYDAKDTGKAVVYRSGIAETRVPVVELLDVNVGVRRIKDTYVVQLTFPWDLLEITPKSGMQIPAELGIFCSDPTGTRTMTRSYWHSGASEMVSDIPTEAAPTGNWGKLILK